MSIMTTRNVWSYISSVPIVLLLAGFEPAHAATPNLAINGSFEVNAACASATTTIHGWNVIAGNVDLDSAACSTIPADQGNFWVDLTGTGSPGTIERNLLTKVGTNYSLTFAFGGNPQCQNGANGGDDTPIKSMRVLLNGVIVGQYSVNIAGNATNDPAWEHAAIFFAAVSSPTVFDFQSLNGDGVTSSTVCGPLLDNVRVLAIQ